MDKKKEGFFDRIRPHLEWDAIKETIKLLSEIEGGLAH
jgi:hypothetical protein